MSPDAFDSKYVTYEWAFALGIGIKVIPLMLEQTKLHPRLDTFQYIPFDDHFSLDQAWEKLLARLKQIEAEYKSSPKLKINDDVPLYIQESIAVLKDRQYYNQIVLEEPNPLHLAVNNLASSQHPVAQSELLRALEHPNPDVRRVTAWVLGKKRRDQAVESLIEGIRDHDMQVQLAAIRALIQIGNEQCEKGLVDALKDDQWEVQALAAQGLANFKTNSSVSALIRALQARTGTVRAAAAKSLSIVGDSRAVVALSKHLSDKEKSVQVSSAKALVAIGTLEALDAFEEWDRKQKNQQ